MAHFPAAASWTSLQWDGRRHPRRSRHARRGRSAHARVGPVQIEMVPFRYVKLASGRRSRGAGRRSTSPSHARTGPTGSAGNDEGRPRDHLGPEPHASVRHVRRHLYASKAGHRRSPTGGVSATTPGASATTPAARCGCGSTVQLPDGILGGLALGATERCPHLHRWLLAPADGARRPVVDFHHDAAVGRRRRQRQLRRAGDEVAVSPAHVDLAWRADGGSARCHGRGPSVRAVSAGRAQPDDVAPTTAGGNRHLRGHRRPPPPLLPIARATGLPG